MNIFVIKLKRWVTKMKLNMNLNHSELDYFEFVVASECKKEDIKNYILVQIAKARRKK